MPDHSYAMSKSDRDADGVGWYGSGADGDVTIAASANVPAQGYMCNNLTINAGVTLSCDSTAGASGRVYVADTLTVNGTMRAGGTGSRVNGDPAAGATGGANGNGNTTVNTFFIASAVAGTAGANGAAGAGAQASAVGASGTRSVVANTSGTGGAGGSGTGGAGGAQQTGGSFSTGTPYRLNPLTDGRVWQTYSNATTISGAYTAGIGGTGGSSGGGNGVQSGGGGGGGGAGGAALIIFARRIVVNAGGVIHARGGNGGNGAAGLAADCGGGGGGGAGSGGYLCLIYDELTNNGTIDANAGTPGTGGASGGGTGAAGSDGGAGTAGIVRKFSRTSGVWS